MEAPLQPRPLPCICCFPFRISLPCPVESWPVQSSPVRSLHLQRNLPGAQPLWHPPTSHTEEQGSCPQTPERLEALGNSGLLTGEGGLGGLEKSRDPSSPTMRPASPWLQRQGSRHNGAHEYSPSCLYRIIEQVPSLDFKFKLSSDHHDHQLFQDPYSWRC